VRILDARTRIQLRCRIALWDGADDVIELWEAKHKDKMMNFNQAGRMLWTLSTLFTHFSLIEGFQSLNSRQLTPPLSRSSLHARRTLIKERSFDPLGIAEEEYIERRPTLAVEDAGKLLLGTTSIATGLTALSTDVAVAATGPAFKLDATNPADFQPVCPASDGLYRFLQQSTVSIVGKESFNEYSPLIAGGLLRIRLEICVVESFFNEAVGPFIKDNGVSWILPLHETVETFLAGTIFAFATSFILIGSSKIISVLAAYVDFLVGFPARLFGGFLYDRAAGKKVTLDIGAGSWKTRLVGPPDEENDVGFFSVSFPQQIFMVFFAVLKFGGQVVGVSRALVLWPCF